MPKGKSGNSSAAIETLTAEDKIARILGILAVKDVADSADKVVMLQGAGFGSGEISSMLDITRNAIDLINFKRRQRSKKKSGKKQ
ncbi:MAG: hypothetical protein WB729_08280 [Candidatus Sulfotelmatobacter sp.]|jgi:hypothetical protein